MLPGLSREETGDAPGGPRTPPWLPALVGKLPPFPNLDRFQRTLFARPGLAPVVGDDMRTRSEA
jgi:hypothetical protein